ncbi:MAG: hypothetical protein EOO20_00960 [Chryseobacterium sp.]|nr:MAG: hypothetical protein EOO20_00960 [Chryseobacterium sp.]
MAKLASLYNPLPNSPKEQNALWYKIYRANMTDIGIQKSHKDFLLARDMASMLFLFFMLTGMPMLFLGFYPFNFYYLAFLAFEYLLVVRAARNYGVSFVNNVLAIEASK